MFGFHHHHHHSRGERQCGLRGGGWGRGGERGWDFADGQRGGGRSGRMFDGTELRLILLKLIADQPRHGYDLIRAIEEASGGAYAPSPGVVYPTLTLLADMGHVAEQEGGGQRRTFEATDAGRAVLAERADQVAALFARLAALGERSGRGDHAPIRRAMMNLGLAIRERFARGEADPAIAHDIAEMLDEVARRIERR